MQRLSIGLQTQALRSQKQYQIIYQQMNVAEEKVKQRNITPNFLRFRRKSQANCIGKKNGEEDQVEGQIPTERTERIASRASRSSFQAYERRVLHLSKLKNYMTPKEVQKNETEQHIIKRNHIVVGEQGTKNRDSNSNQKPFLTERNVTGTSNGFLQRLNQDKKRNSASGKIINKVGSRTPSNQKRTEESLEKEEQRAKQMNAELMQNIMKNQFAPNFMDKLKMKKINTNEKKKPAKNKLLNLIVPVKGEEEMTHYEVYGELGKGAYGIVRMGMDKRTNTKIAIKIYQKKRLDEPNKIKNLEREINILAELSHDTIAQLIDVIQTQTELYLILEYGGANSLYNYLLSKPEHRLTEQQAKKFLLVIAEALMYLHSREIIHRDIKAENILINRNRQLKLIDFGFSLRCKKNETIDTFCGTPTYMAPEIVSKIDHCPIYTDMWSLGILFFVMLQGNYPFRAKSELDLFEKIKKGHYQYIHNDITKQSKKLIQSLLKINPLQRLTIYDVLSKDNRAWLSESH